MNLDAPAPTPSIRRPTPPSQGRGRIGRVVLSTLLGSALVAVVLSIVVLGGATEPVVAGAVLLAFAAGWASLAWLSEARTDQPQRWAWLPAGVFGTIGLAYIAFRPSENVMTLTGWAWPVVLLVIGVWVVSRSRHSLVSWSRRLVLYPIVAVMVLSAIGAAYENVHQATDSARHTMAGQLVGVGDHKLHISCTGTGTPTVILEPGLGEPGVMMAGWIQPAVAATTRVCVYDRAGRGDSEAVSGVQDGLAIAADLHRLLANAHVPGPYVLVGHSSGGAYVKVFAQRYPDQVAGMVLLDAQPSTAYTDLPGWSTFYAGLRKYTGLAPSLARVGAMRLFYSTAVGGLPETARTEERNDWSTAKHNRGMRDEVAALRAALTQSQALTTLRGKPLFVLTAERDMQKGWMPLQDEMVGLSSNSVHRVIPEATHASLTEDRQMAGLSTRAIADVVTAVRTGTRLVSSVGVTP